MTPLQRQASERAASAYGHRMQDAQATAGERFAIETMHGAPERVTGVPGGLGLYRDGLYRREPMPVCKWCLGSGKDGVGEDDCPGCDGSGDHNPAREGDWDAGLWSEDGGSQGPFSDEQGGA